MTTPGQFVTRDLVTIRDSILRVIRNGLIARGISNPNVTPGSDWYVLATAVGLQCSVVEANCAIKAEELMPDSATGDELARWAAIFGLSLQGAAGSTGGVVVTSSAAITVATGSQLYDDAGLRYAVTIGGVFADQATISIAALSTGSATNHAAGDVLRWVNTPTFADEKVAVADGGLINGVDAENDEGLRTRVLAYFQTPPASGNWEHVNEFAEASTSRVKKSFTYPAIQGPSTFHAAVASAPSDVSKSRVVDAATVNGVVSPYVIGKMPTHPYAVITSVVDVNADVAFGLSLPEAPTASPPGLGGGWVDGSPWPAPDAASTFRCTVTAVTSTTQFTVDAVGPPQVGQSHIAWYSPTTWQLYRALVVDVSGTSGAYVITLDAPMPDIASGCYIWPDCQNAQTYLDAIIAGFAAMGPGEKSTNVTALARGFRHPPPSISWPYALGPSLLRAISDAGDEVADVMYFHRTDGTTTLTGSSGLVKPQVPASVTDGPRIFIPRHIGLYRAP